MEDYIDYGPSDSSLPTGPPELIDYGEVAPLSLAPTPILYHHTAESPGGGGVKREYDWSSIVQTTTIVAAAPRRYDRKPSSPSLPSGTVEKEYEKPPMKVSWIPDDVEPTRESLLAALVVNEDQRRYIWSIDQREPDWHKARAGRLTGSRAGTAAGHSK